jgi:hypothetical protein
LRPERPLSRTPTFSPLDRCLARLARRHLLTKPSTKPLPKLGTRLLPVGRGREREPARWVRPLEEPRMLARRWLVLVRRLLAGRGTLRALLQGTLKSALLGGLKRGSRPLSLVIVPPPPSEQALPLPPPPARSAPSQLRPFPPLFPPTPSFPLFPLSFVFPLSFTSFSNLPSFSSCFFFHYSPQSYLSGLEPCHLHHVPRIARCFLSRRLRFR